MGWAKLGLVWLSSSLVMVCSGCAMLDSSVHCFRLRLLSSTGSHYIIFILSYTVTISSESVSVCHWHLCMIPIKDMQNEREYGIHSYIFPTELLLRLATCTVGLHIKWIRKMMDKHGVFTSNREMFIITWQQLFLSHTFTWYRTCHEKYHLEILTHILHAPNLKTNMATIIITRTAPLLQLHLYIS
jgi:hypothetical protein